CFFQAEDGIRDRNVTGVQTCALPICAQIEVNITIDGEFMNAKVIDNERTIVPMTLDSANRSGSAVRPHYLHDKLFYVAGDYMARSEERRVGKECRSRGCGTECITNKK